MVIDAILKPGIAGSVSTRLAFQHDGAAIGQDQAVPDEEDAALPERRAGIILPENSRSL